MISKKLEVSENKPYRRKELMHMYSMSRIGSFTQMMNDFDIPETVKAELGFDMHNKRIFPPSVVRIIFNKLGKPE